VSKKERAAAVDCLEILKLFPEDAITWMTSIENINRTIQSLGGVRDYCHKETEGGAGQESGDDDVNSGTDEAYERWKQIKSDFQQQQQGKSTFYPDKFRRNQAIIRESITGSSTPSKSMDELMKMIGLSAIKEKCLSIYDTICLLKKDESNTNHDDRPDRNTVMNFLFVGNPGVGKVRGE
jgi:hypothetical protein